MNKKIKQLLQQAEVYRKQGLLNEARKKYEQVAEIIKRNDKIPNQQKLLDGLSKKMAILTEAVKAVLAGAWNGKDSWGGTLVLNFNKENKVTGTRSGGYDLRANYTICGSKVIWRSNNGTLVTMTVVNDHQLEGTFERGGYGGTISMDKDDKKS